MASSFFRVCIFLTPNTGWSCFSVTGFTEIPATICQILNVVYFLPQTTVPHWPFCFRGRAKRLKFQVHLIDMKVSGINSSIETVETVVYYQKVHSCESMSYTAQCKSSVF